MTEVRKELPPLPDKMRGLHIDERGYPVPWFVAWVLDGIEVDPLTPGSKPDFRIMGSTKVREACGGRCWICGGRLGAYKSFVVGPMCVINRNSAEPPSHRDCAIYAAIACPFLTRPHMRRREAGMPETAPVPGIMLDRNPGAVAVWTTKKPGMRRDPNGGLLFDIGEPESVLWYAEGRDATHEEVMASIDSGYPSLLELAEQEGPGAVRALSKMREKGLQYLPVEIPG